MADELDNFITELTTVMAAMTGIKGAPENPPEGLNDFPVVVCWIELGRFTYSQAGPCIGMHRVNCDVHLGRSNLPEDEKAARPYILRGLTAIAGNLTMSSTCEHCLLTDYRYGRLGYGESETFGVRFILDVKIKHSGITVAA